MEGLIEELKKVEQEHIVRFFDSLTPEQQASFEHDIKNIDWTSLHNIYTKQVLTQTDGQSKLKAVSKIDDSLLRVLPPENIEGTTRCDKEALDRYRQTGLEAISHGKVGAILLAGGQGTRLGSENPKGMFDIGLPSRKSLFQLQAERIIKLGELVKSATGQASPIIWYIMTSEATMGRTKEFFEENNYFGLSADSVVFFEQNTLPCMSFDGKVLLDQKHKISRSPNGNGGLYEALHQKGIIENMTNRGVEYVHVYCVDNILVRVCDPVFMGYCISKGVDTGAKVVEKVSPNEAVGVICKVSNQFKVIEYSEISDNIANARDPDTGRLLFNAANICEHFFKVDFLKSIKDDRVLPYHIAFKKIPHVDIASGDRIIPSEPNGIKLEKFIFDVFEFTDKFAAWEVDREDEFSPLKNGEGSVKDNPSTARQALLRAYENRILDV